MIQLTEAYRPKRIRDFAGLTRAKALFGHLAKAPYESAWMLEGASGTGKTTLALALAEEIGAQVIHVPAADCTIERVREIRDITRNGNMFASWYVVLVDEADRMSPTAQVAFLSMLDATGMPKGCIFVFTTNEPQRFEDRFRKRCREIEFDGGAESQEVANFLTGVWYRETGGQLPTFRMRDFIESNGGNVRGALMAMEMELICQAVAA